MFPARRRRIDSFPARAVFSVRYLTRQDDLALLSITVIADTISAANARRYVRSLIDAHVCPAPDRRRRHLFKQAAGRSGSLVDAAGRVAALVPGQGGGSSRLCIGHQLDIEPSKDTSIRLPLEESGRLPHSTHCLVPSRQGEPFDLVTSSDHAHTTVVLRRSVSDRLESPRADPLLHCSGRRIYGCLLYGLG